MILDRLKAQPELMEALGVKLHESAPDDPLKLPSVLTVRWAWDEHAVDFKRDNCPGSAILTIRCRDLLMEKLIDERAAHDRQDGTYSHERHRKLHDLANASFGSMTVEAALLAVLEVAEGK